MLAPRRYVAVLISTLCVTVIAPLIEHGVAFKTVLGVLIVVCSVLLSFSISYTLRQRVRMISLALLSSIMWSCSTFLPGGFFHATLFEVASSLVCLLFFANACHIMIDDILSGPITGNRVCGAVCVYILVGFCFALLHTVVALIDPSAYSETTLNGLRNFQAVPLVDRYSPFVYFSFCTLSSVGFGDIVAVSRFARTVTWLEAVFGQFYMAVLVARLVGLYVAHKHQNNESIRDTREFRKRAAENKVPALVD
jgi:voltage-gated potassium channel